MFFGLVESRETSKSEPRTFRVINITKPQAAMLSSLNIEVRPIRQSENKMLCKLTLSESEVEAAVQ